MSWLTEAAQSATSVQERRSFMERARDKFMEAQSQEHDLFHKASAQYQLGNCWALLGSNERARIWYQRAHASAVDYLYQKKDSVQAAYQKYITRAYLGGGGPALGGLVGAFVKLGTKKIADRTYRRYQDKFTEEALPELTLISALEQLRIEAPDLSLEFETSSPTTSTIEQWFDEAADAPFAEGTQEAAADLEVPQENTPQHGLFRRRDNGPVEEVPQEITPLLDFFRRRDSGPDIPEQIKKLAELRDSGAITAEEFDRKKAELLDRM